MIVGEVHYHWAPGMEYTLAEHTSTTDFVDSLTTTVVGKYTTMDLLNVAVEQYMLQQSILCRAVHKVENMKNSAPTKLLLRC